ncbi:hypothetical protein DEI48_003856 [Salmonella enterica subsp. enterica serovar Weltevreden]|nr:hypothetical protein [Salmonella enterica subsp. enterica serovar Weltevreden]EDU1567269.1 hypothetical protein [Salmonella enterica subsp. enterica serovar Weltevreden]
MQTINNRMTETQIADLFSLAVQLQVKAEESDDRDTAILAYSIQNACSNLTESQREFRAADATIHNLELKLTDMAVQLANAESKCRELAAENAGLKNPENWLLQSDYGYEASEVATQNGATEDESLRAGMIAIINRIGTPATDAFLAEVRASAIPEGYVLVPQQIFLDPSDIESICSQCGDGHESGYGDFTDGLLWVGNIQRDDGSIVHGLHISSADYTEEGGVTVCEFSAQLRKGDAL